MLLACSVMCPRWIPSSASARNAEKFCAKPTHTRSSASVRASGLPMSACVYLRQRDELMGNDTRERNRLGPSTLIYIYVRTVPAPIGAHPSPQLSPPHSLAHACMHARCGRCVGPHRYAGCVCSAPPFVPTVIGMCSSAHSTPLPSRSVSVQ